MQDVQALQYPSSNIGRIDNDENGKLLPQVMSLLRSLPGAKFKHQAINMRDAVIYNGVAFVDTHNLCFLEGCAPDITVTVDVLSVTGFSALALIELQVSLLHDIFCEFY